MFFVGLSVAIMPFFVSNVSIRPPALSAARPGVRQLLCYCVTTFGCGESDNVIWKMYTGLLHNYNLSLFLHKLQ
jgi:hypothetical protein